MVSLRKWNDEAKIKGIQRETHSMERYRGMMIENLSIWGGVEVEE